MAFWRTKCPNPAWVTVVVWMCSCIWALGSCWQRPLGGRASLDEVNYCGQALRLSNHPYFLSSFWFLTVDAMWPGAFPIRMGCVLNDQSEYVLCSPPMLPLIRNLVTAMREATHTVTRATSVCGHQAVREDPGLNGYTTGHRAFLLSVTAVTTSALRQVVSAGHPRGCLLIVLPCIWLHLGQP